MQLNMKPNIITTMALLLFFQFAAQVTCQNTIHEPPIIGAQVIIEPGQTPEEIDSWFRILKENDMKVCRIRMFEIYMHKPDGTWDYSLFDRAFKSAEKNKIKVFATIFPSSTENSVGGFKFPESDAHFANIAEYIKNIVNHFKQYSSLYGWVLLNEPGTGGQLPNTDFTANKFNEWKARQTPPAYNSKGYTKLVNFDREKFLVDYTTWFLNWIADEIHKYDPGRHVHVNNHMIFRNVAEYNFPEWRKFLTSLGASAHPSWHFDYFQRSQYAMAVSANCDIIRSGAGQLPFWVTELQGGNNTYSGLMPFCPTKEEIIQWQWSIIGSGAKGIIFWCLNPRSIGWEAGEWALLDFQYKPSDRLIAASKVSQCINKNNSLFAYAVPLETGISIIFIREALWAESKLQIGSTNPNDIEGRMVGGVMKSALAFYETLIENGVNSNLQEIGEYDWDQENYSGKTIILANQITVPSKYWSKIIDFVAKGGKLIVDGNTAFYDENMLCLMNTGFPFEEILGGTVSEFKCNPGDFIINLDHPEITLPAHLWKGYIIPSGGKPIATEGNLVTGIRNSFKKGETLWIPSLIGLGASREDNSMLSQFLMKEIKTVPSLPVRFKEQQKEVMMRTMISGKSYITIIINKSESVKDIELLISGGLNPTLLYTNNNAAVTANKAVVPAEGTMVVLWQP
jgi:beta-galactosidase